MSLAIFVCVAAVPAVAAVCPVSPASGQAKNRGWAWLIGALLICPCHLPLTLGFLASVLAGTAAGALVSRHPYVAGGVVTAAWLAAAWRGIRHLQSAERAEILSIMARSKS
jgi:mercuric ion transport protein